MQQPTYFLLQTMLGAHELRPPFQAGPECTECLCSHSKLNEVDVGFRCPQIQTWPIVWKHPQCPAVHLQEMASNKCITDGVDALCGVAPETDPQIKRNTYAAQTRLASYHDELVGYFRP